MLNLVTGGSGFIGSHIVRELIARGEQVRVLDVSAPHELPQATEFIEGSVTDRNAVANAVKGVTSVFHTAANAHLWSPDKRIYQKVNRVGTRIILEESHKANVQRVVHTSSLTVLVGKNARPLPVTVNEDVILKAEDMLGPYCLSKLQAEQEVQRAAANGLGVVTVLPTLPIGPGDHGLTAPTKMILDLLNGRIPAYLECMLNLIDVRDLAVGHILARDKGRMGERYLLGHRNMPLSELLSLLHEMSGVPTPKRRVPYALALVAAAVSEWAADYITRQPPGAPLTGVRLAGRPISFDSSKAIQELGLPQRPIETALEDEIRWFVKQGLVYPSNLTRPQAAM